MMYFQPMLYFRGLYADGRPKTCDGWFVGEMSSKTPAVEFGDYKPTTRNLAVTTALLLDQMVNGPAPDIEIDHRSHRNADLFDYALAVSFVRQHLHNPELQVGDVVRFPDGVLTRVAQIWPDGWQPDSYLVPHGSYHMGDGYVSHSGGLDPCLPWPAATDETEKAIFWIYHHNRLEAGCGVTVIAPVRVWELPDSPVWRDHAEKWHHFTE